MLPRCRPHPQVAKAQCTVVRKYFYYEMTLEKLTLKPIAFSSVWVHWGPWGGVRDSGGWRFICQSWSARQSIARHWDGWARPAEVDPHIKEVLRGEWIPEQIWECSGVWMMSRENTLHHILILWLGIYWNLFCARLQHEYDPCHCQMNEAPGPETWNHWTYTPMKI